MTQLLAMARRRRRARAFAEGAALMLAIGPTSLVSTFERSDARALASDWSAVGKDMRGAIDKQHGAETTKKRLAPV